MTEPELPAIKRLPALARKLVKLALPDVNSVSINLLTIVFVITLATDICQSWPHWVPKDWEVTILMGGLGMKAVYESKKK